MREIKTTLIGQCTGTLVIHISGIRWLFIFHTQVASYIQLQNVDGYGKLSGGVGESINTLQHEISFG